MFQKLMIANRGEIAIRIARTAAALGVPSVAIHPRDDARCLHTRSADQSVEIPGTGVAAYLDIAAIVATAVETGCDAVHPGYGLLSENAGFATACAHAGLIFVGPAPETLTALGDKTQARRIADDQDVPTIPGRDSITSPDDLAAFLAKQNGAAVMVKAAAGGGGRGMRPLRDANGAEAAFAQCQGEAMAAFGDGRLYGERLIENARHIEVQIIGDGQTVRHLWDRDCTLQRRHQKVVELAPAPLLSDDLRQALLQAATRIAAAQGYRGLGTVEFLVEPGANAKTGWYFIEVNPRIQVEHTVTEDWLGLDLVALQLRLAAGEPLNRLDLPPTDDMPGGQALQLRITAQPGPITPGTGQIDQFILPGGPGLRIDTHGYAGYRPHPGFDPLLAKVILRSPSIDLGHMLARARRALGEMVVTGLSTNIALLDHLLARPGLADWAIDTATADSVEPSAHATDPFFDTETTTRAPTQHDIPPGTEAITAALPAVVTSLDVAEGQQVARGQVLAVIEAMKMQHELTAPQSGTVATLLVQPGDTVEAGQPLILIRPDIEAGTAPEAIAAPDPDHIRPDLQALLDRRALTQDAQRPEAMARRRARGQRTARENVTALLVGGDFIEYGQLVYAAQRRRRATDDLIAASPADGIITGIGHINADRFGDAQSRVAVLAYDGSVMAGTQGMMGHLKTDRILELARDQRLPVIFYTEGGGGRPGDTDFADVMSSGLGVMTFNLMTRLTADKPSIGVNAGYCFAGNAAVFGACDIRIATRNSWIGLGGPAMVEAGGLGAHKPTDIGPAPMQARIGLVDLLAEDEGHATALARQVMGYFQGPLTDWSAPDQRPLRHVIPENRKRVYDIHNVIDGLADQGSFLELRPGYAPGMITGFLRIGGQAIGLIANNPGHLGGAVDAAASAKGAGFLTFCARFEMPVLSLCDTPGFMVGPDSEAEGGVQQACALLGAGAQMADRLFCVVLRKGYGIGAQAMAGGSFAAPVFVIAWPTGEFGAMGLEGAVQLGYRRELEAEPDPDARQALFDRLVAQSYEQGQALNVAALTEIDAVIDPAETRDWVRQGLRALPPKSA